jgi:hypothetical protein
MNYAQLNEQHICIGVSQLFGDVPREIITKEDVYNLETGEIESTIETKSFMVRVPIYTPQYLGKKYLNQGKWGEEDDVVLEYDETLEYGYESVEV